MLNNHSRVALLVVDDDPAGLFVSTLTLEDMGYTITSVPSAHAAISLLEDKGSYFSAILMDINMKDMNGFQAAAHIRGLEQSLQYRHTLIALTAHSEATHGPKCAAAGFDGYLDKPIKPEKLARILKDHPVAA